MPSSTSKKSFEVDYIRRNRPHEVKPTSVYVKQNKGALTVGPGIITIPGANIRQNSIRPSFRHISHTVLGPRALKNLSDHPFKQLQHIVLSRSQGAGFGP